jgi:hypothetical protein
VRVCDELGLVKIQLGVWMLHHASALTVSIAGLSTVCPSTMCLLCSVHLRSLSNLITDEQCMLQCDVCNCQWLPCSCWSISHSVWVAAMTRCAERTRWARQLQWPQWSNRELSSCTPGSCTRPTRMQCAILVGNRHKCYAWYPPPLP